MKSDSGRSFLADSAQVTSENIHLYKPSRETQRQAVRSLEKAGFKVTPIAYSLTVEGQPALFETYFKTKMEQQTMDGKTMYQFSKDMAMPKIQSKWMEAVIISRPPDFFKNQ